MKKLLLISMMMLLPSCANLENRLPENQTPLALRLIQYRDDSGQGLIPVARNVGETRSRLWQRWLATHRAHWQNMPYEKISGQTQWCAQWFNGENENVERLCRRDDTLIWFGRGILRDPTALQQANQIWKLK